MPIRPQPASNILVLTVPGSRVLLVTLLPLDLRYWASFRVKTMSHSLEREYASWALQGGTESNHHGKDIVFMASLLGPQQHHR